MITSKKTTIPKKNIYPLSPLGKLARVPLMHDQCVVGNRVVSLSSNLSHASAGKYRAARVRLDGHTFHSGKEARRYSKLCFLAHYELIKDLDIQPPFPIIVNEKKIKTVYFDFAYTYDGERYFEDVKGVKTDMFKLNWKLVTALYPTANLCII